MARKFDPRVWYQEFKCPKCSYKSIVTDVHRHCPNTPADNPATQFVYCSTHKTYHRDDKENPTMHHSLPMEKTEWAKRFNPRLLRSERRKVKNLPKDAILK